MKCYEKVIIRIILQNNLLCLAPQPKIKRKNLITFDAIKTENFFNSIIFENFFVSIFHNPDLSYKEKKGWKKVKEELSYYSLRIESKIKERYKTQYIHFFSVPSPC